jgi:pyroglutamyl-peptidase
VRLERFALNAPDLTLEDVDGRRPPARYIREDGPAAYESGLPIERLLTLEVPEATLVESHYAGGYLCNFTFYEVMHLVARERRDLTAGFVHVPPAARQPLAVTTRAMRSIIEELVGDRDDSESSEPAPRMPNEGANL